MRPLTFDERKELILRAQGQDIVDFVHELDYLGRKYKMLHQRLLALLDRAPKPKIRNFLRDAGRQVPESDRELMDQLL